MHRWIGRFYLLGILLGGTAGLYMAFFAYAGVAASTILGEEFVLRGVLLPKMNGVFSRWDWVTNGILMEAYHWHQPWMIPAGIVACALFSALPAKRFRITWTAVIPHDTQIVVFGFLILGLVLGLA